MKRPIERAWVLQQHWSAAATAAHNRIEQLRTANLVLLVFAALAGAAAGVLHENANAVRALGVVGAVLLGAAGLIQQRFIGKARVADWVDTRLASERLKSAVWRALALGQNDDSPGAAMLAVIELSEESVASRGTTREPHDIQPLPTVTSIADYEQQRAGKQASWHRNKADVFRRRSRSLRAAELIATLLGIAASALAAGFTDWVLSPIVACITTIAAALAAHLSASKYERVAAGYERTASRLATLSSVLPDEPDPDDAARFVDDVERVLAEQNAAWLTLLSAD